MGALQLINPIFVPKQPGDAASVCLRARVQDRATVCIACSAFFVISRSSETNRNPTFFVRREDRQMAADASSAR
jgi:hypothetical protein